MQNCQSLPLNGNNILSWRQPPGLVVSVSAVALNRQDWASCVVCSNDFFHPPSPPSAPPPAPAIHLFHSCNAAHSLFNIIHAVPTLPHSQSLALTDSPSNWGRAGVAVSTGFTFSTLFRDICQWISCDSVSALMAGLNSSRILSDSLLRHFWYNIMSCRHRAPLRLQYVDRVYFRFRYKNTSGYFQVLH